MHTHVYKFGFSSSSPSPPSNLPFPSTIDKSISSLFKHYDAEDGDALTHPPIILCIIATQSRVDQGINHPLSPCHPTVSETQNPQFRLDVINTTNITELWW
mmetsp:Transcript_36665/g.53600  ORF Transcript_36665/g.53600 Transcript_36665/m.53600 type:complete len:101 (-) Transcript_36665:364-666(-)